MSSIARPFLPTDRAGYERSERRSVLHAITALALSSAAPGRPREEAADLFLQRAWGDDPLAGRIIKAAVSPTSTGSYPVITSTRLLQSLAPASASAQLFARCLQVDLTGVAKVRIPHTTLAPQPGFVAEGGASPVAQFTLAGVDCGPVRKVFIDTSVTGELERATPGTASAMIGRELAAATTKSVDAAVFGNVAADSTRPAGLLNGITPITATAITGGALAAAVSDLGNLVGALADAGIATNDKVFVAHPETATKLLALVPAFTAPVIECPQIAVGMLIAIAPAGITVGQAGTPEIETNRDAALHFEDTAPLQIATGAQGSGVLATPTKSAFQHDLLVIRVRARCAWCALPGAVQVVTGATW